MMGTRLLSACCTASLLALGPATVGVAQTTTRIVAFPVVEVACDGLDVVDPERLLLADAWALRTLELRSASAGRLIEQLVTTETLEELSLDGCPIDDADCRLIAAFTGLKRLSLPATPITDDGVAELVALVHLRRLDLRGTRITDDALEDLARLPALHTLDLRGCRVSRAGIVRLRERRPQLRVVGFAPR